MAALARDPGQTSEQPSQTRMDQGLGSGQARTPFPRAQIRWALEQRRLRVAYQPLFSLHDQAVVGHEALARLLDRRGVLLNAEVFIDVAAQIGLEPRIDADITAQAMAEFSARATADAQPHKLFLNCSAGFLVQPQNIAQLARQHRAWARGSSGSGTAQTPWVIEITERSLDVPPASLLAALQPLLDLGFELALDDFGGDRSAFSYLLGLPLHYLKLDKTLVQDAARSPRAERVLRQMQGMAGDLGMLAIAEGISCPEEFDCMRSMGIAWGQGHLWGVQ